jgi:hypothetical protein
MSFHSDFGLLAGQARPLPVIAWSERPEMGGRAPCGNAKGSAAVAAICRSVTDHGRITAASDSWRL